jgi:DNA-binding transcriptional regulator YhcF (GntR family)
MVAGANGELSLKLGVSPTTAQKAITALKNSGFLASRPGKKMLVTVPKLPPKAGRLDQLNPLCAILIKEAAALQLTFSEVVAALRSEAESILQAEESRLEKSLKKFEAEPDI